MSWKAPPSAKNAGRVGTRVNVGGERGGKQILRSAPEEEFFSWLRVTKHRGSREGRGVEKVCDGWCGRMFRLNTWACGRSLRAGSGISNL